jgi:hypothetical protein
MKYKKNVLYMQRDGKFSVMGAPGLRFVLILEIEIFMTAYCASPCTLVLMMMIVTFTKFVDRYH